MKPGIKKWSMISLYSTFSRRRQPECTLWSQLYQTKLPSRWTARSVRGRAVLAAIASAAAPDYSGYANLIAKAGLRHVLRVYAEVRFAAAFTALIACRASSVLAERPGRQAGLDRLARQRETGQRHSYKAARESFQGLPPRY
jgi:hypothetical protein